jgi:hypothetical protein
VQRQILSITERHCSTVLPPFGFMRSQGNSGKTGRSREGIKTTLRLNVRFLTQERKRGKRSAAEQGELDGDLRGLGLVIGFNRLRAPKSLSDEWTAADVQTSDLEVNARGRPVGSPVGHRGQSTASEVGSGGRCHDAHLIPHQNPHRSLFLPIYARALRNGRGCFLN